MKIPFWNDCTGCEATLARVRAELAEREAEVALLGQGVSDLLVALHQAWADLSEMEDAA
jgi:hypothetical protein